MCTGGLLRFGVRFGQISGQQIHPKIRPKLALGDEATSVEALAEVHIPTLECQNADQPLKEAETKACLSLMLKKTQGSGI